MKTILYSSFQAIQHDCPEGHAKEGKACKMSNGAIRADIVCPKRRALVKIVKPGQYITVNVN